MIKMVIDKEWHDVDNMEQREPVKDRIMVLNTTFNKISVISWWCLLKK
jgi:hypothetical protein